MKKNERLQAFNILLRVLQDGTPLLHLLYTAEPPTPLTKEICFGVCRHHLRLEALADQLMKKRPKSTEVWVCILIGLYQLHYLRIPDYAVVKETVELLSQLKKIWAKGLVNAVLRTYCREQAALLDALQTHQAFQYGHPEWFIKRVRAAWPAYWEAILEANDEHPPMTLRVNLQRTSTLDYLQRLTQAGIRATLQPHCLEGIRLETPCDVRELPGFEEGDVSVQDGAAQLAATLLDLKPGLRVLDACAAPGGKTCHLLEKEPQLNTCVAIDIDPKRLTRIQENLNRLHLNATLKTGDALHPETWWDGIPFDRILLDAPCSATGVIRRHPDIKRLRTESEIQAITLLQQKLLQTLWPLLAPKGLLVYATCSILPEENEQQLVRFLENTQDAETLKSSKPWGHDTGHGWQILPGEDGMDGFFYGVLCKIH